MEIAGYGLVSGSAPGIAKSSEDEAQSIPSDFDSRVLDFSSLRGVLKEYRVRIVDM